jgi:hypothetical protein
MLSLSMSDAPTKSASAFIIRYILPRAGPPALVGPLARNPFFNLLIGGGDLAIFSGHGSPEEQTGEGQTPLWTVGKYDISQTEGKVVKLLSCDAGQILAPDLVQYGKAKAVLAYDQDYLWVTDSSYNWNPYDDPQAGACLLPVVAGLNALLDGATAQESLDVEKAGYMANMNNTERSFNKSILKWNFDHAVLFGDPNARITARSHFTMPLPPPPLLF